MSFSTLILTASLIHKIHAQNEDPAPREAHYACYLPEELVTNQWICKTADNEVISLDDLEGYQDHFACWPRYCKTGVWKYPFPASEPEDNIVPDGVPTRLQEMNAIQCFDNLLWISNMEEKQFEVLLEPSKLEACGSILDGSEYDDTDDDGGNKLQDENELFDPSQFQRWSERPDVNDAVNVLSARQNTRFVHSERRSRNSPDFQPAQPFADRTEVNQFNNQFDGSEYHDENDDGRNRLPDENDVFHPSQFRNDRVDASSARYNNRFGHTQFGASSVANSNSRFVHSERGSQNYPDFRPAQPYAERTEVNQVSNQSETDSYEFCNTRTCCKTITGLRLKRKWSSCNINQDSLCCDLHDHLRCDKPGMIKGRCRADFTMYSYNSEKNECVAFQWGGCDNDPAPNRFLSAALCEETCDVPSSNSSSGKVGPPGYDHCDDQNCCKSDVGLLLKRIWYPCSMNQDAACCEIDECEGSNYLCNGVCVDEEAECVFDGDQGLHHAYSAGGALSYRGNRRALAKKPGHNPRIHGMRGSTQSKRSGGGGNFISGLLSALGLGSKPSSGNRSTHSGRNSNQSNNRRGRYLISYNSDAWRLVQGGVFNSTSHLAANAPKPYSFNSRHGSSTTSRSAGGGGDIFSGITKFLSGGLASLFGRKSQSRHSSKQTSTSGKKKRNDFVENSIIAA